MNTPDVTGGVAPSEGVGMSSLLQATFAQGFVVDSTATPIRIGTYDFYPDGIIEDPNNPGKYYVALVSQDGKTLLDTDGTPFAKVLQGPIMTSRGEIVQLRKTPKKVPGTRGGILPAITKWYNIHTGNAVDISQIQNELEGFGDGYDSYTVERQSWGESFEIIDGIGKSAGGELALQNNAYYRGESPVVITTGSGDRIHIQSIHRNFLLPFGSVTQFTGIKEHGGFGKQMFFDKDWKQVRFDIHGVSRYMTGVLFVCPSGCIIELDGGFEKFIPHTQAPAIQETYGARLKDIV